MDLKEHSSQSSVLIINAIPYSEKRMKNGQSKMACSLSVWIALKNYQLSSGCQETELMQMTNQEG